MAAGRVPRQRLVDDQVGLAAGQRGAIAAEDSGLVLDVAHVGRRQIAEDLVGGAVGEDDDVFRVAGGVGQAVHAVDESEHDAFAEWAEYALIEDDTYGDKNLVELFRDSYMGRYDTEEDFAETMALVREIEFDSAYTFIYSRRSGTKAAEMEGQIPREVKSERIGRLIALQDAITKEINDAMVGKTERVLIESASTRDPSHLAGRTSSAKMVNFEGPETLIGEFADVKITEAKRTTLFGILTDR